MPADLEGRLRDAFREDAARARLANPDRPAGPATPTVSVAERPARQPGRVIAAAAAIALLVAAGIAVARDRDATRVTTSPDPTEVTTTLDPAELFPDLAPDATIPFPSGPTGLDGGVWTGSELIAFDEPSAPDRTPPPIGAAFDPKTERWRDIAPAPIDSGTPVAWTGREVIVWGGRTGESAAYDPAADTWRRLPGAPIATIGATAVWTGDEVVAIAGVDSPVEAAAYDPSTNEWRVLGGADGYLASPPVWTGTTILVVLDINGPDVSGHRDGKGLRLARYDLAADTWRIDADARYVSIVGIPETDGVTRTVLAMPVDPGQLVERLDASGNSIESLPAQPLDLGGSTTTAKGVWVGNEAVFWIDAADSWLLPSPEAWALDPATKRWRQLPADVASLEKNGAQPVAVGDVLLLWDGSRGIAYRAPT